jgi:hypothetical protein
VKNLLVISKYLSLLPIHYAFVVFAQYHIITFSSIFTLIMLPASHVYYIIEYYQIYPLSYLSIEYDLLMKSIPLKLSTINNILHSFLPIHPYETPTIFSNLLTLTVLIFPAFHDVIQ